MRKTKKISVSLMVALTITATCGLSVSAARDQGTIGDENDPVAAYDYSFKNPFFPWNSVTGYSNTSFVVSKSTIDSGFYAYSYIYGESDDKLANAEKIGYVEKGTNYAHTGDISLNGYTKNCHSTHKSVYPDGNIDFSKSLNSSD